MKKRFSETQIIEFLREADAGVAVKDLYRRHGFCRSELLPLAEQGPWARGVGRQTVEDAGTGECSAEAITVRGGDRAGCDPRGAPKKVVGAPARREAVRWMCGLGLTERHALRVIGMSASSVRYYPARGRMYRQNKTRLLDIAKKRVF